MFFKNIAFFGFNFCCRFQIVYTCSYPPRLLLRPIRYAMSTIMTSPARAAPTAIGTTLLVEESLEHSLSPANICVNNIYLAVRPKLKLSVFVVTLPTRSKPPWLPKFYCILFPKIIFIFLLVLPRSHFRISFRSIRCICFFLQYCLSNDTLFPNTFWSEIKIISEPACPWKNICVGLQQTQNLLIVALSLNSYQYV